MSCRHQGIYFGANYEDGICIDGYMWDLDSCDEPGGGLSVGGDIACPECNHDEWLKDCCEDASNDGYCAHEERQHRIFPTLRNNLRYPDDYEALKAAWESGYDDAADEKQP